ncbi:MAG: glycosyltransferase family 4 protein [Bacteroidales bacterium]|nr:glycosyltransferase family 4 protein [Bacteroidales bacterium]
MKEEPIVIAIDCRQFTYKITGIASVLRCLLDSMLKLHPEIRLVLFTPSGFDDSLNRDYGGFPNVTVVCRKFVSEHLPKILWYNIYFPFLAKMYGVTHFLSIKTELPLWLPSGIRTITFVHDVVAIDFAQTMEFRNRLANRLFFSRSIRQSDFLWCVSDYTASQVIRYFPEAASKIAMVGSGSDADVFRNLHLSESDRKEFLEKFGISGRPLLFVGSLEPRKNLSFLLKLMPQLYKRGFQLIVVGAKGWKNSDVADIVNLPEFPEESVHFCGYVTSEELVKFYNFAECYVSTSLNEGFGLPQLEAMLCGCRVISPDNSAMSEVVGGRGLLIESWDEKEWVEAIESYCDKPFEQPDLSPFLWENLTESFIKILRP